MKLLTVNLGIRLSLAAFLTSAFGSFALCDESKPERTKAQSVQDFLNDYCVDCHNADDVKGNRSFEAIAGEITDEESLVDYQDILDQLNLSEMPPSDAEQPSSFDRMQAIELLTRQIEQFHAHRKPISTQTVLRRINAREYRNTIRDLLKLDTTIFDPAQDFPRDQTSEHLDNNAEWLVTSSHLLERYLLAADLAISKALLPLEKPIEQTWKFTKNFRQQPEIDNVHGKFNRYEHMTLYDVVGADKPEGAYGPILAFADGVPHDGVYEIRLRAEAVNRSHPYDEAFIGTDRERPFRLGIVPGEQTAGELHLPQPIEPLLAEIELADEPTWYTVRVRLDKGYTPRFTFRNGLMDVRDLWGKLVKKYPEQFDRNPKGIVEVRRAAIVDGKLPQIRIHEIEITGPIFDRWPTASQELLLGDDFSRVAQSGLLSTDEMRSHVQRFASLAYRRPATDSEIEKVMRLIAVRLTSGRSPVEALADGFKTVLCSPNFLYLGENTAGVGGELDQYALASRLSYFLWSSMPDQELIHLAQQGRLADDAELTRQTQRMLSDSRSDAMIDGFLDSWLALRQLGSAPPDRDKFTDYYRHDLAAAMREETDLFFRHLVDENLSLENFIDSNFSFVNRPLANLYGIDAPAGPGFAKVQLNDRRRGGLLGQASVLTVSANGFDTSPVVRGVWMLENFLGTPPSPPPPDVEPLDPDTRGAKTIREQLAMHRNVSTCNECHRKIDPLGFALENYDPIGRWRDRYVRSAKIDSSGELPDGESFTGIQDLKKIMLKREPQFARAMAEKMLAYATGRMMATTDRPAIDKIASSANGTRELIEQVVLSETFRSK